MSKWTQTGMIYIVTILYINIYLLQGISFRFINTDLSKKYSLRTGSQLARASVKRDRRVAGIFLRVVLQDSCLMPPQLRITLLSASIILLLQQHHFTLSQTNILNNKLELHTHSILSSCLLQKELNFQTRLVFAPDQFLS